MIREFSLSVPASLEISHPVRKIAEDIFLLTPLSERGQNQLKLVFSEVIMNAIKHGSKQGATIYIHFTLTPDKLRVAVDDEGCEGKRVNSAQLQEIVAFQEQNDILTKTSGRGLAQIVKKWADTLEILDSAHGGITVIFEKNFVSAEEEAAIKAQEAQKVADAQRVAETPPAPLEEVVFHFGGTIDEINVHEKAKAIEEFFQNQFKTPKVLILDFTRLEFFLSIFIGKVVEWRRIAVEKGGDLKIININPELFEILDLTGVTHIINVALKPQ